MALQIADIYDQTTLDVFNNVSFGNPSLVISGTAANIKTTTTIQFRVNGQAHILAATDTVVPTAYTTAAGYAFNHQLNGTTAYYLVVVDAALAVSTVLPPVARAGDPDTTGLLLGALPANKAVIGIMKVIAASDLHLGTDALTGQVSFAAINSYPANGDPTGFTYASTSA